MDTVTHESRQIVAAFWAAMQTNDFRAAHAYYLMSYSLVAFSGLTSSHGSEHNFRSPFTVCLYGMNRL